MKNSTLLRRHVKKLHEETIKTQPKWAWHLWFPRKPRNGFKS